jgi:ribosome biogenesis GTPase
LGPVVVGDEVLWEATTEQGVVIQVLPRRTCIEKHDARGKSSPMAANIDQLVIVVSPIPAPQQTTLDRYLVLAAHYHIVPILVFNKVDLLRDNGLSNAEKTSFEEVLSVYATLPFHYFRVSTFEPDSLQGLKVALQGQISLVVGQSGVGKSSLIQQLVQDDAIVVGDLSKEGLLGKHTTTVSRWYFLAEGGAIVDSPGVRELKLPLLSRQQLLSYFPECKPYLGACRFRNCAHTEETPGCALWEAVRQHVISGRRFWSLGEIALETFRK